MLCGDRARARGASPQPRSAMVQDPVLRRGRGAEVVEEVVRAARVRMDEMKCDTGFVGQEESTWLEKPAWYSAKREGVVWKRVREVADGVV